MRCVVCLSALPLLASFHSTALADAPTLDYCKPAGLQRGTVATIELSGKFDWPIQVDCPGAMVECLTEKGKLLVGIDNNLVADRVWLRLYNAEGASVARPLLIGNLHEVAEQEPNNRVEAAQDLAEWIGSEHFPSILVNGVLEKSGDIDCYSVELQKGQTLVAAVEANEAFESPMDAILQVTLPDGTVVDENHDAVGLDPRITFEAPENGTYCVQIFAWPSQPNQRIQFHGGANYVYRLTLATGPYLLHAIPGSLPTDDTKQTASVSGWNLTAAESAVIPQDERIRNTFPELEPHGLIALAESSLEYVGLPKTSQTRSPFRPPANLIRVRRHPPSLVVNPSRPTAKAELEIEMNSIICGTIKSAGEEHTLKLPLKNNQSVAIVVEALQLHSRLVPWLRVTDSDSKVLSKTKITGNAADAALDFRAPADGDYQLVIRDRFQAGSKSHFYRCTVCEAKADFELSVSSEQVIVKPDDPVEVEVTVKRRETNTTPIGDITIEAVDLPTGVTCEPVVSTAKDDSKSKVKLVLRSSGIPFSGRFRVKGTHADTERFAKTPPRLGVSFDRIWLTVLPKKTLESEAGPASTDSASTESASTKPALPK